MAWKMTHPDSKHEIQVEAAQVPLYQAAGWLTHADEKSDIDLAPVAAAGLVDPPSTPKKK